MKEQIAWLITRSLHCILAFYGLKNDQGALEGISLVLSLGGNDDGVLGGEWYYRRAPSISNDGPPLMFHLCSSYVVSSVSLLTPRK